MNIKHANLTLFQGNSTDADEVEKAIAGQDAVTSNNVVREALYGGLPADTA